MRPSQRNRPISGFASPLTLFLRVAHPRLKKKRRTPSLGDVVPQFLAAAVMLLPTDSQVSKQRPVAGAERVFHVAA